MNDDARWESTIRKKRAHLSVDPRFFVTDLFLFFFFQDEGWICEEDERNFFFSSFNYQRREFFRISSRNGYNRNGRGMMERLREVKVCGDRRMTVQGAITWFVAVIRARGTADKRAAWFAANSINLGSRGTYVRVVRATHWACRTQRLARG